MPKSYYHHPFFGHEHYSYNKEEGGAKFEGDINRFFERNGLAFELKNGEVIRIAPTGLQEALAETVFKTGDKDLDRLLETAREKFCTDPWTPEKRGWKNFGMRGSVQKRLSSVRTKRHRQVLLTRPPRSPISVQGWERKRSS